MKSLSRARLFATPWTAAYQAPPSTGFSRQEYWSGLPLPSLQQQGRNHNSKQKLVLDVFAFFPNAFVPRALITTHLVLQREKSTVLFFKARFFSLLKNPPACFLPGDVYKEEIWVDEEGIRAERAV